MTFLLHSAKGRLSLGWHANIAGVNGRYEPDLSTWLKTKCLNREEFLVVGWSDPEGSRHRIGALLLGYYAPDGDLIYAGHAGIGMSAVELERPMAASSAPPGRQDAAIDTTTTRWPVRLAAGA